jgi:hypothetical protein
MSKSKVSVDVRVDPSDKASCQGEADAAGVSVSELVRQRMKDTGAVADVDRLTVKDVTAELAQALAPDPPELARTHVNVDAEELQSLRGWLDLADSDGYVDNEQLESWKAFAARSGITFSELLTRVVRHVNVAHL